MLTFLRLMSEGILDMGAFITSACIEFLNLVLAGVALLVNEAFSVLPSMSGLPTPKQLEPELLEHIGWFAPIAGIVAIDAAMLTPFLVWMGVRWVLRLAKAA